MTLFRGKRMSPIEPANTDRNRLIQEMISASTDEGRQFKRLTPWEKSFLESVADQWERHRFLSEKQFAILERIYAEKIS